MRTTVGRIEDVARADDLVLRLGVAPQPPRCLLEVPVSEGLLELRLLDQAHQVILRSAAGVCSELVGPGREAPERGLPARLRQPFLGLDYFFRSTVRQLTPRVLATEVDHLVGEYGEQSSALVGVVPGQPDAVVVIAAKPLPGGLGWRSWHAYPGTGELVSTASRLRQN